MHRSLRRIVPVVTAGALLALPALPAHAGAADYTADPDYKALATASVYTQSATIDWANITQTATMEQPSNGFAYTSTVEVGYNTNRGEYAMKQTYTDNGADPAPMPAARAAIIAPAATPAVTRGADASPSANTAVWWFGANGQWGDYQKIDRRALGPVERQALKALGVPNAQFEIGYNSIDGFMGGYRDAVLDAARTSSPAYGLTLFTNAALGGFFTIDDITSQDNADGTMTYTLTVTDTATKDSLTATFLVNADGFVTTMSYAIDAGADYQASVTSVLSNFTGKDSTIAQPNPNAVTVDRAEYRRMAAYFYAADEMRWMARALASDVNYAALLSDVNVSAKMIQRAASSLRESGLLNVTDTSRGVAMNLAEYPRELTCEVRVKSKGGTKQAVTHCAKPKKGLMVLTPDPNEIAPRR